jgi:hypothetical protein
MSLRARLVHPLAIVTPTAGTADAYGHATAGTPTVELVAGLVQPRSAREVELSSQAGAEVSTHVVFLEPRALSPSAWIRFDPDDGRRFDVTGVRDYAFGRTPHLEVDVRMVRA